MIEFIEILLNHLPTPRPNQRTEVGIVPRAPFRQPKKSLQEISSCSEDVDVEFKRLQRAGSPLTLQDQ